MGKLTEAKTMRHLTHYAATQGTRNTRNIGALPTRHSNSIEFGHPPSQNVLPRSIFFFFLQPVMRQRDIFWMLHSASNRQDFKRNEHFFLSYEHPIKKCSTEAGRQAKSRKKPLDLHTRALCVPSHCNVTVVRRLLFWYFNARVHFSLVASVVFSQRERSCQRSGLLVFRAAVVLYF